MPIDLFAGVHANINAFLTANTDAFGLGKLVLHRPAWQVLGQTPTPMRPAAPFTGRALGLRGCLGRGSHTLLRRRCLR